MSRRRHVFILVALLTVTAVIMSSGAFSTTAAERDVSIEIAEDPNAYLGFEQTQHSNDGNLTTNATQHDNGERIVNVDVAVINQFPAGTELTTVEITANGTSVDLAPLASGERATHAFPSVSCGDPIRIEASGGGMTVYLERAVDCT